MEDIYQHTVAGAEINETDVNLFATEAALADDHVFTEMLRLTPSTDGSTAGGRGVLPAGYSSPQSGATPQTALVAPSGSANATVYIAPFRAFVTTPKADAVGAYKGVRSALCSASGAVPASAPGPFGQAIQHVAATLGRWDLIYVRVDVEINGATVNRFVKTGSTASVSTPLVSTRKTTATLGVVQGSDSSTPGRPALPADSGGSYYIALAYVLLPAGFTLTTAVPKVNINEVAPVLQIHRATGAAAMRIANGNYLVGGYIDVAEPSTLAAPRAKGYIPPTMGGEEKLFFGIKFTAGLDVAVGGTVTVDTSTDWRNRCFRVQAAFRSGAELPWTSSGSSWVPDPTGGSPQSVNFIQDTAGQSFHVNGAGSQAILGFYTGAQMNQIASSSQVELFVDMSDGGLKCKVTGADPGCSALFWVSATGRFDNAF